jgi:parallel beta-helix repeat protein
VLFTGNTLRANVTALGELIALDSGSNNRVINNTLTGGYDGGRANVGTDDGIVIFNERGDTVDGNSISNFYDAGFESVGALTDTRLTNNTMSNLGVGGFGAYWCSAWTNNLVEGNRVTSAPWLVRIFYDTGQKCFGPIVPAAFSGNQFVANLFRDPALGTSTFLPPAMSITMPGLVENNLIQGNDLGTANAPQLSPLSGFIDGGGNLCGPLLPALSNFPCAPKAASLRSQRR